MIRSVVFLLLLSSTLIAGEHGITIQASCPWKAPFGYTPIVITAEAPRDLTLTVAVGDERARATSTIHLAGSRTVRQTLLIPPSNDYSINSHRLEWSGPGGISGAVPISDHGHQRVLCALIDPKQQVDEPTLRTTLTKQAPSSRRSGSSNVIERVMPEELPDRWQGYPDWLVLVLTPQGDAALDDAQRSAIAAWTRSGGTLVVSTAALHSAWESRQAVVAFDALTGEAKVLGEAITDQVNEENWQPIDAPVPGTEVVPVKTFVILALAFAIVVGPLNLWWVRRRNARHLFLITTPALSFATCVVLIIASLIADGVSVRRSAVQVGYLDHRTQQLVRWTGCTYFAAFARSSLELDREAKFHVLAREDWSYRHRYRDDGQRLHLDWSAGQRLSGSVLPPRRNHQLAFTEHRPERRRLVVARQGDAYQVVNGLGVVVLSLTWRDADGRTWTCRELAAGENAPLQQAPGFRKETASSDNDLPSRLAQRLGRSAATVYERVMSQPLTFSATLAAPLDGLPGPDATDPEEPEVLLFGHLPLGSTAEAKP